MQWPSDESLRLELARLGSPRLLLVDPEADPPEMLDAMEDWVRLPVSRADRLARIRALETRADETSDVPVLSPEGTLEYRGRLTQLSGIQLLLLKPMLKRVGVVVSRNSLIAAAWPDSDGSPNNLDVNIGRLRRQLRAVRLTVKAVRGRGYYVADADPISDPD